MPSPVWYIAGPMTGYEKWNYPAFNAAARYLRNNMHYSEVRNPAENFGGDPEHPGGKKAYMRADFGYVLEATFLLLLPGWEKSSGAQAEVRMAEQLDVGLYLYDPHAEDGNRMTPLPYDQLPWNISAAVEQKVETLAETLERMQSSRPGHPEFYQWLAYMGDVHEKKNQDYADAEDPFRNFRANDIGITDLQAVVMRMQDKWQRIKKVARGEELAVKDDTVVDSFVDMANLAIIALIIYQEGRQS